MDYQVIVIGGGPGGYTCAIRCAQLGFRVGLVEEQELGGVCLNRGCIPTKALYAATKLIGRASVAAETGIDFGPATVDVPKLAEWKDDVVSTLVEGIATLLEKNGVAVFRARGRLDGPGRVALSTGRFLSAERIVLATGSSPIELPGFAFTESTVWSSDDALDLPEVPARLTVIGGGVIGLELATIYRRLGSRVTVIELLPEILPTVDLDRRVLSVLKRSLAEQGIAVLTGTAAESYDQEEDGLMLLLRDGETIETDRILLAVGRRPNVPDLGLESIDLRPEANGSLTVDEKLETRSPGVFAIGDVVPGPMLAHKASAEGVALADSFDGRPISLDHDSIPQAIFTDPEAASVGLSEQTAKKRGSNVLIGRFPYAALGKALGMREPTGFFQIVADANDHRVLGAQIVGAEASDLISEAALAIQSGLSLEAIADAVHPHPTLPEGLKEAAENALGRAIHIINR